MALNQRVAYMRCIRLRTVGMDYQDNVLTQVFEQDRRIVELNAVTMAKLALRFDIRVVLSTVAVEMGSTGQRFQRLQRRSRASGLSTGPQRTRGKIPRSGTP